MSKSRSPEAKWKTDLRKGCQMPSPSGLTARKVRNRKRLALGLDSSTQSLSAVVIDIDAAEKCFEHSLDYRADARLNRFGIGEDYILPPSDEGEAEQPPLMYLASLDAMFADLREAGVSLENILLINTSGQQHGHVYLNRDADALLAQLASFQNFDEDGRDLQVLLERRVRISECPDLDDREYLSTNRGCPKRCRWEIRDD